ncbi:MAG: glycosyltransferase family 2 protein, partial [Deltaproteobacteria bacterium]|nr:glycosyltransferase family 2 protein [Deltaproteobacteria bacterium]
MTTVVRLSRNFGHQQAITAGISIADGDALILMDGDLEDPPELISDLLEKWKQGHSVVLARRKSRQASFLRKLLLNGFYKVFQFLSDFPIPLYSGVFCLLDRRAYNQILNFSERNRFIPGLRAWIGFKTAEIWFDREERHSGKPKQTIWRLVKYASDAIFSFSYKPLRLSLAMGLFIFVLSSIYTFIILILRLLHINVVSGFTTISIAVFFFGSTILVSNGIIGEYLGRIYDEVKQRPLYIIDEVIRCDERGPDNPETAD